MRTIMMGFVLAALAPALAQAAEITVFCPGAVQSVVRELVKTYEQKSGNTIKFAFGTAGAIAKRVADGERGDVVMATAPGLAKLAASGQVIAASIRELGRMGVGVAVRAGAPKPDISTAAAFKAAMLAARSITYANPAGGGQSGIHVAKVFADLGIEKELQPKLRLRDRGPEGFRDVAAGETEIGLGQISEILANKGVELVGPLPPGLQAYVTFAAALHSSAKDNHAAQELIDLLTSPAAQERFKQAGFTMD